MFGRKGEFSFSKSLVQTFFHLFLHSFKKRPAIEKERVGDFKDSVAQLVEHNTFNVGVLGPSPSRITQPLKQEAFLFSKA